MAGRKKGKKRSLSDDDIADITGSQENQDLVSRIVKEELGDLTFLIKEMKQSLDKSLAQTNQLHEDVQTLKTASLERDNTIKGLEDQINFMNSKISTMDNQINDLEQYGRNSSVRIYGYALAEHTDTTKAVIQLFNGLNINLQPSEIVAAHPLPMRQYQDRPHIPPIIVKFLRNSDKDRVIMARKGLKGRTVSIHDDLTLKNKQLLNRVRNDERVETSWSFKGCVWCLLKTGENLK